MASLYAEYIKEREGKDILEIADGFVTYEITNEVCYIADIYIRPHMRKSQAGATLANTVTEIARQRGCSLLLGSVALSAKDPTTSVKILLAYGFKVRSYEQDLLWFDKIIER